jgi:hypothetical protein
VNFRRGSTHPLNDRRTSLRYATLPHLSEAVRLRLPRVLIHLDHTGTEPIGLTRLPGLITQDDRLACRSISLRTSSRRATMCVNLTLCQLVADAMQSNLTRSNCGHGDLLAGARCVIHVTRRGYSDVLALVVSAASVLLGATYTADAMMMETDVYAAVSPSICSSRDSGRSSCPRANASYSRASRQRNA